MSRPRVVVSWYYEGRPIWHCDSTNWGEFIVTMARPRKDSMYTTRVIA